MILASQVKGNFMKTEQMSSLTRSLCNQVHQYNQEASQDKTLTGYIKGSLEGRALLLVDSLILHAEAVCRAIYICFLTIKQIFSQSREELLLARQKGECTVAYDASLRFFFAALFFQKLNIPLVEKRSAPPAQQTRIVQPLIKQPQAAQQGKSATPVELRINISGLPSLKDDYKYSDRLKGEDEKVDSPEYHSLSRSSQGQLSLEGYHIGGPAILVDVDACHFPESPEIQPLFANLDTISQAGSEPVLMEPNSPKTKSQLPILDTISHAGSEPVLVDGNEPNSPIARPQLPILDIRSHAGSEPVLVDGNEPNSPIARPQLPILDIRSRASSEPVLVDGNGGKDLVSPKAQLFANIDIHSQAGSEPSLINGEDRNDLNSPKTKPLKSSASSENDYVLVKPEDIERLRAGLQESMQHYQEVERIEEEGQKYQALQLELALAKRQVNFLNKKLERLDANFNTAMLAPHDHPSEDGELIEILREYENQENTEFQEVPHETTASVKSFDVLSRSSDPIPLIIEKDRPETEVKAAESPRSQSSGELV